jgi:hypothetical protein
MDTRPLLGELQGTAVTESYHEEILHVVKYAIKLVKKIYMIMQITFSRYFCVFINFLTMLVIVKLSYSAPNISMRPFQFGGGGSSCSSKQVNNFAPL